MFWIEGFGGEWIPLDRSTGCKPDVSTLLPPVVNHPKQTAQESGDLLDMFLDLTGGEEGDGGKKTEEGKGERAKGKGVDGKEGVVVVDASKPPPRARTLPSQMQMQFQGEMNRFLISNPDAEAHQAGTSPFAHPPRLPLTPANIPFSSQ